MAFMLESAVAVPSNANGRPAELIRAVRIFESNNMFTLETNVNNFLNGIRTTFSNVIVFSIALSQGAGGVERVLISYGYFQAQP